MVANTAMLQKPDVIAYVAQNAQHYGLDPAAVLAVADHEGLSQDPVNGVAPTWVLPGEGGAFNFGPPSWQSAGAGAAIVQNQGGRQEAANWSWTPAGLDYWLQSVAQAGASGKQGMDAIVQIVGGYGWGFERPASSTTGVNLAARAYPKYEQQVADILYSGTGSPIVTPPNSPGNITIPPNIFPIPGGTLPGPLPIPSNPQTPSQTTTGAKFSLHIFDLPTGPVNLTLPWDFSGILLFLAALLAIIIGALMWDKSRTVIVNTAAFA